MRFLEDFFDFESIFVVHEINPIDRALIFLESPILSVVAVDFTALIAVKC